MLPPAHPIIESLRGYGTFTRVISYGKKFEQKPLKGFLQSSASQNMKLSVGFAVTRGIRKAAHRNLVKRYMREAFRSKKDEFGALVGPQMQIEIVFLYIGGIAASSRKLHRDSIFRAFSGLSLTMKNVFTGEKI